MLTVELSTVTVITGGVCVTRHGERMRPEWCAECWDMEVSCYYYIPAELTCYEMISTAAKPIQRFGGGNGNKVLIVNCDDEDESLRNCMISAMMAQGDCNHNRDAGVICYNGEPNYMAV